MPRHAPRHIIACPQNACCCVAENFSILILRIFEVLTSLKRVKPKFFELRILKYVQKHHYLSAAGDFLRLLGIFGSKISMPQNACNQRSKTVLCRMPPTSIYRHVSTRHGKTFACCLSVFRNAVPCRKMPAANARQNLTINYKEMTIFIG